MVSVKVFLSYFNALNSGSLSRYSCFITVKTKTLKVLNIISKFYQIGIHEVYSFLINQSYSDSRKYKGTKKMKVS